MQTKKALLLDGQKGHVWIETLERALASMNWSLDMVALADMKCTSWSDYDLVIIDAGIISDLRSTIFYIRRHNLGAKIVVFAPVPDWEQARDVMLAGAADYVQKSLDAQATLSALEKNFERPAPLWQCLA